LIFAGENVGPPLPELASTNPNHLLRSSLFRKYDKLVKPGYLGKVKFGQHLFKLDLNYMSQELTVDAMLHMSWVDERLKWNKTQWNEIKLLNVPFTELWIPDISVYNGIGKMELNHQEQLCRAIIYPDGTVLWVTPVTYKVRCKVNMGDGRVVKAEQECKVVFGSWTEGDQIQIVPNNYSTSDKFGDTGPIKISEYYLADQIEIVSKNLTVVEKTYNCCPDDVYTHLDLDLKLRLKELP